MGKIVTFVYILYLQLRLNLIFAYEIVKASCIVIFITGLLAGVFFSSSVSAQDISGTWHGKLSIPTGSLTIVFHISQTEQGAYVTTLDSPDQGANGIKTQTTSFNDSTLIIQIPVIHASYKGKLNSDNTINGTFTQGMPLPLNLKREKPAAPNVHRSLNRLSLTEVKKSP